MTEYAKLKEWEYADAMPAIESWANSWLGDEAQHAYIVGVDDLKTAAVRRIERAALRLGWWQDADGVWQKPVVVKP